MGLVETVVAAGTVLAVGVTLLVGGYAWRHRDTRGATVLAALGGVSALEAATYAAELFATGGTAVVFAHRLYLSSLAVGALLWLGFAAVWTDNRWLLAPKYVVPIAAPNVVVVALVWTNASPGYPGVHTLWWTDVAFTEAGGYVVPTFTHGPAQLGWRLYAALQFVGGVALLAILVIRPEYRLYRRQNLLIIAGVVFAFAVNVAFEVSGSPLDPTAVGIAVANVLALVAIFGFGFFDVVPIARRNIVEEVETAMVVYDDTGTVVDANRAARDLLDLTEEDLGRDLRALLLEAPFVEFSVETAIEGGEAPLDGVLDGADCAIQRDGERRQFTFDVSELVDGEEVIGHGVVVHDVTEQRRRERDLDLLNDVLTRVLRHNVRNDLTVVGMYAEMIAEESNAAPADWAAQITDVTTELTDISEKARQIQQVIDRDDTRRSIDVAASVRRATSEIERNYPGASIDLDAPETAWIRAVPDVDVAIENVVENAVVHNDGEPTVAVRIDESDDWTTVVVEDDGPGIPPEEVDVVRREQETPLEHGSGLGLWLVNWVVDRSGGRATFDGSPDGTTVALAFETASAESSAVTTDTSVDRVDPPGSGQEAEPDGGSPR